MNFRQNGFSTALMSLFLLGGALTAEQAVQQRPADAAARQRALAAGQGNHRVLAVDDDPAILDLYEQILDSDAKKTGGSSKDSAAQKEKEKKSGGFFQRLFGK